MIRLDSELFKLTIAEQVTFGLLSHPVRTMQFSTLSDDNEDPDQGFGWNALHDLMYRSIYDAEVAAIRRTLIGTPGIQGVHDIRTRKMGDRIVIDAHIAVEARTRVMQRHRGLNLMTHADPWRRPDIDHFVAMPKQAG